MNARHAIADYMVTNVVLVSPDLEINHAVTALLDKGISGAPVVSEDGKLLGILTVKDCFKAALDASYYQEWGGVVGDYMSREVETMSADLDVVSAAEQVLASPYHRFPVLSQGRMVGLITRSDLLRAFADQN